MGIDVSETRLSCEASWMSNASSPIVRSAVAENVQAIKRWERAIVLARSKNQQLSDWIACTAASGSPQLRPMRISTGYCSSMHAADHMWILRATTVDHSGEHWD